MWKYTQQEGYLTLNNVGKGVGYSGAGEGKNNSTAQSIKNVGPIPCGKYLIGAPVDTITHGPYVLPLTPDPANEMFDRSGFLIHGDSVVSPGTASEGCVILGRVTREKIWQSKVHTLLVVPRYVKPSDEETQ